MKTSAPPRYYVLDASNPNRMLLTNPPHPSLRDRWMAGHRFQKQPAVPVVATIKAGNEDGELLPYFGTANLMSDEFHAALCEAGVDNLEVYEAEIRSENGAIVHRGYKAFNLIGVVRAADMRKTVFNDPPASRQIDASIESLEIDPAKVQGLLMFRLAENVGAVVVHERVKRAIEAKGFPSVVFREPSEFIS